MIFRRRLFMVGCVVFAVAGTLAAPAASAAVPAGIHVKAIVCDQAIALGSTTPCDLPAGGTARFTFTVPSADTVRFRAAVPDSNPGRTLTLATSDGTEICTKESFPQFDCAVPAGGDYRLDVTLEEAATVYTTIDTVLTATCGAPIDVSVGNAGSAVHIADPGGSWCAGIDVAAGEGLEMVLDVNTDQSLNVSVYDNTGKSVCQVLGVTAFTRPGCALTGGGDGYRLFASPYDDTAQDMVLIVTQISHPTGCVNRAPDPFGVAASRRAALTSHQQRCYVITAAAGHGVGVHLFATSGPSNTLFWQLRTAAGIPLCTGGPADPTHRLSDCTVPTGGSYLFVSMLSRPTVRYALSLVDLSSDAGCVPVTSTKWNTTGDSAALAGLGQIDCRTFTGTSNDVVRTSVFGDTPVTSALVTTAKGKLLCEATSRADCRLPTTGTYRVAVSTTAQTTVNYRTWTIDTSTPAGCRATEPDTFGVAPSRRARFTDNVAVCYAFSVPPGAASYYFLTDPVTHDLQTFPQVRSGDGSYVCYPPGCTPPAAGTYLYVVTRSSFRDDPSDIGTTAAGLWRLDQPTGCTAIGTSFNSKASTGNLAAPGKVDCREFAASAGDQVLVRTAPRQYQVISRIFDASGNGGCFAVSNVCTLDGPGTYRLLSYASGTGAGDYAVRVASLTQARGCHTLAGTQFGRAPSRAFEIADDMDLLCYRISMPEAGQVGVRMVDVSATTFAPSVALYGAGASGFCTVSAELGSCPVVASGDYLLIASGDEAADGTLGWYDLASSTGCTAGPTLAFGTAPTQKVINARGAIVCMSVPLIDRDKARFAFGSSPVGARLHGLLLSRAGVTTCDFRSTDQFPANCLVAATESGPLRLIVYAGEDSSTFTGTLRMHVWRLNRPTGCTDIGSLHNGFGPLVGALQDKNDVACYLGAARTGTLAVTTANDDVVDDVPLVQLYRPKGLVTCGVVGTGQCGLGDATYTMLVQRDPQHADYAGHYRVEGTCTIGKCGP